MGAQLHGHRGRKQLRLAGGDIAGKENGSLGVGLTGEDPTSALRRYRQRGTGRRRIADRAGVRRGLGREWTQRRRGERCGGSGRSWVGCGRPGQRRRWVRDWCTGSRPRLTKLVLAPIRDPEGGDDSQSSQNHYQPTGPPGPPAERMVPTQAKRVHHGTIVVNGDRGRWMGPRAVEVSASSPRTDASSRGLLQQRPRLPPGGV